MHQRVREPRNLPSIFERFVFMLFVSEWLRLCCGVSRSLHPVLPSPPLTDGIYRNITLRNVTINNSVGRYGANLLINSTNPATGIVFDSVTRDTAAQ